MWGVRRWFASDKLTWLILSSQMFIFTTNPDSNITARKGSQFQGETFKRVKFNEVRRLEKSCFFTRLKSLVLIYEQVP